MNKLRILATSGLGLVLVLLLLGAGLQRASLARTSYEDLDLLSRVLHLVRTHYVSEVEQRKLVEGALQGMLTTLDPHTSFLSRDLYQELQRDTKGEFEGLGIEITKTDGFVTVVAPIDGTPASQAGIRARDQIVAVCPEATEESCKSTQDMNLIEAVKLMRGPRGSKIMIQVMREGWEMPRPFVLKRASIRVSSVTMHMIDGDIPYVRLSQFQERTAAELAEALDRAVSQAPKLRGLVLDLRANPGGLLDQAVKVADLFLDEGLIVFSEGRNGGNRMEWHAKREGTQPEYPMVVLVDGGSASASEIVSGALQDHHRALVLGQETFGKGSVQTIIPLEEDGSALRLTTALYYLPSGRSIQEVRVQPDVVIDPYSEAEIEALRKASEKKTFGEEHLEGHLQAKGAGEEKPPAGKDEAEKPEAEPDSAAAKEESFRRRMREDRQLGHAVELLKSWTIFSRLQGKGGA